MIIGVPKEVKDHEFRVTVTPAGANDLVQRGHRVVVETNAGIGSGITDDAYLAVGAEILPTADAVWDTAQIIVKVKEPMPVEWPRIKPSHVLFTYFHFASSRPLTDAMIKSGAVCIAYETVEDRNRQHPLLTPMSEVAGRLAVQQGA